MDDKLTFKKLAQTALEAKKIEKAFKKIDPVSQRPSINIDFASQPPSKIIPNNEILYKQIRELQCNIKKLELKLRLVDEEYIDNSNNKFDKLIYDIQYSCDNFRKDGTNEFIQEMKEKNANNKKNVADNKHKNVVNVLNFVLPCLSIFTSSAIPFLINTKITGEDIEKATIIYNNINSSVVLPLIKSAIEGSVTAIDLYSKAFELYLENTNNGTEQQIYMTSKSLSKIVENFIPQVLKIVTNTFIKNKTLNRKLSFSYTSLFFAIFIFSLYIEKGGIDINDKALISSMNVSYIEGGEKVKKPKKTPTKGKSKNRYT